MPNPQPDSASPHADRSAWSPSPDGGRAVRDQTGPCTTKDEESPMNPTDPTENYSAGPPPWEPQPPKRKRHLIRNILLSIAGVFIAFGILLAGLGALAGSPSHSTGTAVGSSSPAPAATTTPPPASPDPKGTDTGSCDYQLGSDPVGGTAKAVGEIDVTNTGNVG